MRFKAHCTGNTGTDSDCLEDGQNFQLFFLIHTLVETTRIVFLECRPNFHVFWKTAGSYIT